MEGREAMSMPGGSAQYYIHRGAAQAGGFHTPPGFRAISNPNAGQAQSSARGGSVGPTFPMEPPSQAHTSFAHSMSMVVSSDVPQSEPVKKKRGRPRKYGPDGSGPGSGAVSLRLSPMSAPTPSSSLNSPNPKRSRGRPPGSGRKQQLAALGEWMNSSAGIAFAPHIVYAAPGEDIAGKILSFAQQRPRAVCILSGSGAVSSVSLKQPAASGGHITYQGRFEILCLSGSYLVAEDGDPQNRTGGVSVSLSAPEGHVVGGAVDMLIAASPVQVVLCTFVYGSAKTKSKKLADPNSDKASEPQPEIQNFNHSQTSVWSGSHPSDPRSIHNDIDLTSG